MGQDKEILLLPGGMDKDTDERLIKPGDYIDALNMHIAVSSTSNQGAGENVRGTLNYPNPNLSTSGACKCIGTFEDNKDYSLIYFIWNESGYHGIFRFFRNLGVNNQGRIDQLLKINFPTTYTLVDNPLNFDQDHFITGVDLVGDKLYWTDAHARPRKINCLKANNFGKRKIFRIYFNQDAFGAGAVITLDVKDANNVSNILVTVTTGSTVQQTVDDFIASYYINLPAVALYTAVPGQGYVEIQMTDEADYFPSAVIQSPALVTLPCKVVPFNFYPDNLPAVPGSYQPFPADFIDAIKYPPLHEPTTVYKTDTSRSVNLVKEKVFQFRCQYVYDDDEKSVWGAISNISIPSITCDITPGVGGDNYIEVDFTDPRLNDQSLSSIIQRVNIAVREHNTGDWQLADSLEPYRWGITKNIYKFYNDKVYQSIDPAEAILPYHALPDLAKSQELIDDRLFYAGITEGHDKIPINASVDVAYQPNVKTETFTIRGVIFIRGLYQPNSNGSRVGPALYQPIYTNASNAIFGGADGALAPLPFENFQTDNAVANSAGQELPLLGFVMYLAGTQFYSISRQFNLGNTSVQGPGGWFFGSSFQQRLSIIAAMQAPIGFSAVPWGQLQPHPHNRPGYNSTQVSGNPYIGVAPGEPLTGVFSTFEITGVPAGKYVMRVADHRTTAADLAGDPDVWQGRSTNVIECGGAFDTEMVVEVNATTAVGGYVYVGRTAIADMAGLKGMEGYIADHDIGTAITATDILADTRIERALVSFGGIPINTNFSFFFSHQSARFFNPILSFWGTAGATYTDHNGYYFLAADGLNITPLILVTQVSGQYAIPNVTTTATIDGNGGVYSPVLTSIVKSFFTRNLNNNISDTGRTYITGQIQIAGGIPVSDANIVNCHTQAHKTDSSGQYKIAIYVDTFKTQWLSLKQRFDRIIFSTHDRSCVLSFLNDEYNYDGLVNPAITINVAPDHNTTQNIYYYPVPTYIATILASYLSTAGWKRGMDAQFGIAYYDEADRRTAVCTADNLDKHINFYSEPDAAGAILPGGIPILSWKVYHEPPAWATKWQWVRTKNTQLNSYLQWAIDDVFYTDDYGVVVAQSAATQIHIRTDNFAFYNQTHPNSTVNYNYQKGDRVRFYKDSATNIFNEYYDFEILDVNAINSVMIILNDVTMPQLYRSTVYEIYTPRLKSNINLFYEFSQCYDVKTAIINGLVRKYHAGQTQDQSFGTAPLLVVTPATGVFQGGNAYYRQRNIPVGIYAHNQTGSAFGTIFAQIDDMAISDFYESSDESIGRPNTNLDDTGKVVRPTAIRVSDRYIQDTKVNGLAAFQPLNQKQLSNNFGTINKLQLINDGVLMAICNNSKIVTMYINKNILRTAAGGTNLLVALTDEVIAQSNILQRTFGTQNPESVMINDQQDVFMWDKSSGVVPRYTGNALEAISDLKMAKYFAAASDGQSVFPEGKVKAPAVYDRFYDEYIVTFNSIGAPSAQFATATVCIPNLEPLVGISSYEIIVLCEPLGIVICDFTVTTLTPTYATGMLIRDAINAAGNGFSATLNGVGMCVTVQAPVTGTLYNNNSIVVAILASTGLFTHQYPLTGGTD